MLSLDIKQSAIPPPIHSFVCCLAFGVKIVLRNLLCFCRMFCPRKWLVSEQIKQNAQPYSEAVLWKLSRQCHKQWKCLRGFTLAFCIGSHEHAELYDSGIISQKLIISTFPFSMGWLKYFVSPGEGMAAPIVAMQFLPPSSHSVFEHKQPQRLNMCLNNDAF